MNISDYEVNKQVQFILKRIKKNQSKQTSRIYSDFLNDIGLRRKSKKRVRIYERAFQAANIVFYRGNQKLRLSTFKEHDLVIFKLNTERPSKAKAPAKHHTKPISPSVATSYTGTVEIAATKSGITLYKHQKEACNNLQKKVIQARKKNFSGLLVLPTGGGKTLTAAYWLSRNFLDKGKKVLWIAHRHELLNQAMSAFVERIAYQDVFPTKQSFNYRVISGLKEHGSVRQIQATDDLIIASKDSLNSGFQYLYNNWLKNNTKEVFLVIDEAHHATAKTYRSLIDKLREKVDSLRILGLTATPFRTAKYEKGLLKKVFPNDIVYKTDMKSLVRLGTLAKPHFEEESTGQNFLKGLEEKDFERLNKLNLTSANKKLAESIAKNRERNLAIVNKYLSNKRKYQPALVFAINRQNAVALDTLFRKNRVKSDFVISSHLSSKSASQTNQQKIEQFRNGQLEVLINVNILTEGTDVPGVSSVFLARPTISTILMTQMIGRGLRGPKAGGTEEAYIVSFIDEWQDKVAWVNPERLFIETNIDFEDKSVETQQQLLRLISFNKIKEFAILAERMIDRETQLALEKLNFIERFPKGIYKFSIEIHGGDDEERDKGALYKTCEILAYNNLEDAYFSLMDDLTAAFSKANWATRFTFTQLIKRAQELEEKHFSDCEKYPAYDIQDLQNVIRYFMEQGRGATAPIYVELKDRHKFDIDKIAAEFIKKDYGERKQISMINQIWENDQIGWQTFFNYDKRSFIREIQLAKIRISYPDLD